MTVLLIVVTVLCVIFLLPIRVKAFFGDGKWQISVYYTLLRVFHRETKPKPPPSPRPPRPDDPADALTEIVPLSESSAESPPQEAAMSFSEGAEAVTEEETPDEEETAEAPVEEETAETPPEEEKVKTPEEEAAETSTEEKAENPAKEDSSPEEPKKKQKKPGFFARLIPHTPADYLHLAEDILPSLSPSLKFLLRHFHFRHVKLYVAVGSNDPAKTAMLYGTFSTAVYQLIGALQSSMDFEVDECRILADFFGEKIVFRGELELRCSPAALVLTVLILGFRFLWKSLRRFHKEDKETKCREREQRPQSLAES